MWASLRPRSVHVAQVAQLFGRRWSNWGIWPCIIPTGMIMFQFERTIVSVQLRSLIRLQHETISTANAWRYDILVIAAIYSQLRSHRFWSSGQNDLEKFFKRVVCWRILVLYAMSITKRISDHSNLNAPATQSKIREDKENQFSKSTGGK